MSDELTISGGGAYAIATDELHAARERLARLAGESAELGEVLRRVDALHSYDDLHRANLNHSAFLAEVHLRRALGRLGHIESQARWLGAALGGAIDGYGFAEATVGRFVQDAAATLAGTIGFALGRAPGLAMLAAPVVPAAIAGLLARAIAEGGADAAVNRIITDPATVALVRLAVASADEAALGALGAPPMLADVLGDPGLGSVTLGTVATGLVGAGALAGLTRETPVLLAGSRTTTTTAPSGWAQRLERVPAAAHDGGTQVVVERYEVPGEPDRFGVFVGGTVDFGVGATGEPWDMTSNLGNAAGADAGSVHAVLEAMRRAGVGPDNPVQLTGYSQGGAIAAIIAASGDFTVAGVVTFGGNTGHVPIPPQIPTVLVEHTDDIVPASSGVQHNTQALLVERRAYADRALPDGVPVPAHQRTAYADTARLMDAAESRRLTDIAAAFDEFTAGATTATSTHYHYDRVHSAAPSAGAACVP